MLTVDRVRELLHYDPETGILTWKVFRRGKAKAGTRAGQLDSKGHRQITINNREYLAHRLIWFYVHGVWPANQIDHINRVRDDNRFCNLREATAASNRWNCSVRGDNRSGVPGVGWNKEQQKWRARIAVHGEIHYLGSFDTLEEARLARERAERFYFGEFVPSTDGDTTTR